MTEIEALLEEWRYRASRRMPPSATWYQAARELERAVGAVRLRWRREFNDSGILQEHVEPASRRRDERRIHGR